MYSMRNSWSNYERGKGKESHSEARGGGTPLFGLYGYVPLDGVWFFGLAVLNSVYNLTCLCPKQV